MTRIEKGSIGYWAGKSRKGLETHPAVEFECKQCSTKFKRSHYAYKKGLENPKMMPKYCSRVCQLTKNTFREGHIPSNAFKPGETVGELNHNWKGGITPLMESIRRLSIYKDWRKAVYERDDYTCQHCNIRGAVLNADHIYLFSKIIEDYSIKSVDDAKACEKLWDISNGQTLCKSCHNKKTTVDLVHVHKDPNRMRGLNRKGGIPGRKWKPKPIK